MSKNVKTDGIPPRFAAALAEDIYAQAKFDGLPDREKRAVIDGARSVSNEMEMRDYLNSFVGTREPKGPVQL